MIKPQILKWQKGSPDIKDFPDESLCLIDLYGFISVIRSDGFKWYNAYNKNSGLECNSKQISRVQAYLPVDMQRLDKIYSDQKPNK